MLLSFWCDMHLFVLRQWPGHSQPIYVAVRNNILPALGYVNQQLSTQRILVDDYEHRIFPGRAARRATATPPTAGSGRKRRREKSPQAALSGEDEDEESTTPD